MNDDQRFILYVEGNLLTVDFLGENIPYKDLQKLEVVVNEAMEEADPYGDENWTVEMISLKNKVTVQYGANSQMKPGFIVDKVAPMILTKLWVEIFDNALPSRPETIRTLVECEQDMAEKAFLLLKKNRRVDQPWAKRP